MKKFFAAVLFIAVAAVVGYGVKYALTPLTTQKVGFINQEESINTNGFIIRDEWVLTSRSAGTAYTSVGEGERVAKYSVIGTLFYGDVPEESINELAVVDNKIKTASKDKMEAIDLDETTVENTIYKRENEIIEAAADNDILSISKYKMDINSLRLYNTLSSEGTSEELEAEKQQILANIGVAREELQTDIAGIFTTYIDDYENILMPSEIWKYDVQYFQSLSQSPEIKKIGNKIDAGGAVCKIINNHVWYVMMSIPVESLGDYSEGYDVKLRMNNMAGAVVNGSIYSISAQENGRLIVTVKCSTFLENILSYRLVDVDLIFNSYEGVKIPAQAIRTEENGRQKVIGISGGKQYDCYCDVLYVNTQGSYAIINSSADAENKLSQMDRILVGER